LREGEVEAEVEVKVKVEAEVEGGREDVRDRCVLTFLEAAG